MKKVLALVMSLVLVIGIVCAFASCGGKDSVVVGYTIYEPMNYLDENGEWVFIYHSRDEKCFRGECGYADGDPLYDPCRSARKRKVIWNENGLPILNG